MKASQPSCSTTTPASPLAPQLEGRELAPDPQRLHHALKRTTVRHAGEMTDEQLVEALAAHDQALVIVNSRGHALKLYRLAEAEGLSGLVHLTTRQYAAHRRRILAEVRRRLDEGRPCRLIAISLIEAGVDVDFPVGWRAEAGLDQIVHAGAWVETPKPRPQQRSPWSLPSRERGSKPSRVRPCAPHAWWLPPRGAWSRLPASGRSRLP